MSKKKPDAAKPDTTLHRARERAPAELHLEPTDDRVKRYAMLLCAYDQLQSRVAANKQIDVGMMLKIDSAMAETRALAAPPLRVEVEYVSNPPPMHWCKVCGHTQEFLAPPLDNPDPPPRPIADNSANVDTLERPIADFPNLTPPKPPPEPPKPYAEARDFHGDGAPVKDAIGARNEFLGSFTPHTRPYSPAIDPGHKPRTGS